MRLIILANLNYGQNIIFKNFVKIRKRGYTNKKVWERVPPPKKWGNSVPFRPPPNTPLTGRKQNLLPKGMTQSIFLMQPHPPKSGATICD